jgi:hypothetical protein
MIECLEGISDILKEEDDEYKTHGDHIEAIQDFIEAYKVEYGPNAVKSKKGTHDHIKEIRSFFKNFFE